LPGQPKFDPLNDFSFENLVMFYIASICFFNYLTKICVIILKIRFFYYTRPPVYKDNNFLGQQLHFFAKLDNNFWTPIVFWKKNRTTPKFFEKNQFSQTRHHKYLEENVF